MGRFHSGEILAALVLIIFGLVALGGNLGLILLDGSVIWPLLLVAFGGWLIWKAFQPSTGWPEERSQWGVGEFRPDLSSREIRQVEFSHGFGDVDLDLTRAIIPEGESTVHVSQGMGDLMIVLPREVAVRIRGSAGLGDVFVLGERAEGFGPTIRFESDDYPKASRRLALEARVGLGQVRVLRAG